MTPADSWLQDGAHQGPGNVCMAHVLLPSASPSLQGAGVASGAGRCPLLTCKLQMTAWQMHIIRISHEVLPGAPAPSQELRTVCLHLLQDRGAPQDHDNSTMLPPSGCGTRAVWEMNFYFQWGIFGNSRGMGRWGIWQRERSYFLPAVSTGLLWTRYCGINVAPWKWLYTENRILSGPILQAVVFSTAFQIDTVCKVTMLTQKE